MGFYAVPVLRRLYQPFGKFGGDIRAPFIHKPFRPLSYPASFHSPPGNVFRSIFISFIRESGLIPRRIFGSRLLRLK
jgi:hypothetical protein